MPNADPANGLKPGYWHILRYCPAAPVMAEPLEWAEGPQKGAPREPGGWMLDMLQRSDMWNDLVVRERKEMKRKLDDAKERQRQREAQERIDELNERMESAQRESILFSPGVRYKAKAGARVPA